MSNYESIPGFEHVYLEDSWVLGIRAEPGAVALDLEVVLKESHPAYTGPAPGEQYCYRRGAIRFASVEALGWTGQGVVVPAVDGAGERDFGSIDEFVFEQGRYMLEGDFGRLEIMSPPPAMVLLS